MNKRENMKEIIESRDQEYRYRILIVEDDNKLNDGIKLALKNSLESGILMLSA